MKKSKNELIAEKVEQLFPEDEQRKLDLLPSRKPGQKYGLVPKDQHPSIDRLIEGLILYNKKHPGFKFELHL